MISSILMVCVGNVCRSPMSEAMMRKRLPGCRVESAGIGALVDSGAEAHAVSVMRDRGIDISSHRARQVSAAICRNAELILVMDAEQKYAVEQNYTFTCGRVFQIGQFSRFDVPDPYQRGREQFSDCADLIEQGISDWVGRIAAI
ncbi:low molecular weight protein-tyrosine-phosphatase [Paraburkholderia unamae]|uniref:protein-tyrosine-phosphatase n=1 Tax=Paraburkholderia unamae TaxID=219649 RepID=A0ABX5KKB3_9BURK|nr:low molecular weight protein-tyrosine-phosphatase [Paraburkholderia unamae]PVX77972.1 protein tyrosine phosphatase [Paraburkholderia unamae]RAR58897.1 protein tyrosine phosphatase [Paraburkholderia unamae]